MQLHKKISKAGRDIRDEILREIDLLALNRGLYERYVNIDDCVDVGGIAEFTRSLKCNSNS